MAEPLWYHFGKGKDKLTPEEIMAWIPHIRADVEAGMETDDLWKKHFGFGLRYPRLYSILISENPDMNMVILCI